MSRTHQVFQAAFSDPYLPAGVSSRDIGGDVADPPAIHDISDIPWDFQRAYIIDHVDHVGDVLDSANEGNRRLLSFVSDMLEAYRLHVEDHGAIQGLRSIEQERNGPC